MNRDRKIGLWFISAFFFLLVALKVYALPQGVNKISGDADFDWSQTNSLHVKQNTDKIIVEYQGFSIAANEGVYFHQPSTSSTALNRVVGIDPSTILGKLVANGRIILINPNGVVFGPGSQVDTAGIVASTMGISNSDFLNGIYHFSGPGGYVINQGRISAPGGFVALLGADVLNTGVIAADLGSVTLASGDAMTLSLDAQGIMNVVIEDPTTVNPKGADAAVKNLGTLSAEGGKVLLTAKALSGVFDHAINNTGIIEATSLVEDHGQIALLADKDIKVGGQLRGGDVTVISDEGNVTHLPGNEITTQNDNFRGFAKLDYDVGNDTYIDTGEGTIDIYGGENVYLGDNTVTELTRMDWEHISATRDYLLKQFGIYYDDPAYGLLHIALSAGYDVGKDGTSPASGSYLFYGAPSALDLYTYFVTNKGLGPYTWYTDPALNADHKDHIKIVESQYGWEDLWMLGDQDFDDAVFRITQTAMPTTPGAQLNSLGNVFITAQNGEIAQVNGDINAGNLMLKANTGIHGTSPNNGVHASANYLTALNNTSGGIQLENTRDLTVKNLVAETGLNPSVTGGYDVTNFAIGGLIDILVHGDLTLVTPVIGAGDIVLTADNNIRQLENGFVNIMQNSIPVLNPPANVHSTSHEIAVWTNKKLFTAEWGLPEQPEGLYQYRATAGKGYQMAPGTSVVTNGGDATITANEDITLALVNADNGNTRIVSQQGSILDADLGVAPGDYDVIARHIDLQAPNGTVGTPAPEGEIDVGYPDFDFSYVFDTNSLTVPDAIGDPYTALFAGGDWVFSTTVPATYDSPNWNFHILALRGLGPKIETLALLQPLAGPKMSEPVHIGPYYIDMTKPVITAGNPIGILGADGYYHSPISVPFSATDNMSGFAPIGSLATALATKTIPGPGTGLTVTSDVIADRAGNIADPVTVGPFDILYQALETPQTYEAMMDELRVYYEILSPSQFVSVEPVQKIGLYAYHPLSETDESAFDELNLDVGAYEFIEQDLKKKERSAF